MNPVPLTTFSRFCVAGEKVREEIVDYLKAPKYGGWYTALRGMFRRAHWKTGDIDTLVDAKPNADKDREGYAEFMDDAEVVKQAYIDFWRRQGGSFFCVPKLSVPVGDLTVKIDPEVGMETVVGAQALKVRFNSTKTKMSRRQLAVCHYLFGEAAKIPKWPGWPIAIWDVRQQGILLPRILPGEDIPQMVADAAVDFKRLWDLV